MDESELMTELAPEPVHKEKGDLAYFADMAFAVEHVRVSAMVRLKHLAKLRKGSPDTDRLLELATALENFVDGKLADVIVSHPTWSWAQRIKGVGRENLPKVVGLIEAFGKHYPPGDPLIPPYVTRPVETYWEIDRATGEPVEKQGIWVAGIERLSMPSKLWKYSGEYVSDGHAARREAGKKLAFNADLRMAFFRLATSLMRAQGIWYSGGDPDAGYSRGYEGHKAVIRSMKEAAGYKIVPTPRERMCLTCGPVVKKAAKFCPTCGERLATKTEPPGVLYEGHLHAMALRLLIKDFQVCLWRVWREALKLPVVDSYPVAHLAHPRLDPWKMVDR